jgi:RNA-directed DNA polymerase
MNCEIFSTGLSSGHLDGSGKRVILAGTPAAAVPAYRLTRWADDWVVTCRTRAEAESALALATKILASLGVTLNREKTRIVHIAQGFEFLGFKIGRGKGRFRLNRDRITSKLNRQNLYAIPTQKSLDRFKDQIRALTQRKIPLRMGELIETINPVIRGWGN